MKNLILSALFVFTTHPLTASALDRLEFGSLETGGNISVEIGSSILSFYALTDAGERIEDHYLIVEKVDINEFFGRADREFMKAMTETEITSGEVYVIDYTESEDPEPLYWALLKDVSGRTHLFHLEEDEAEDGSWIFNYQGMDSEYGDCEGFLKASPTLH